MEDKSNKPMITDEFMEWEERDESVPFLKHCIAGSCAGIMEHMGLYPIDTLKVSFFTYFIKFNRFFIFFRHTYKLQDEKWVSCVQQKSYIRMRVC